MEKQESEISKELSDLGYKAPNIRRGLIKWILGGMASVILMQAIAIKSLYKDVQRGRDRNDSQSDKYTSVFLEMLKTQNQTLQKVDTTKQEVQNAKNR